MQTEPIGVYKGAYSGAVGIDFIDPLPTALGVRWRLTLQWYLLMALGLFVFLAFARWFVGFARCWWALHYLPGPQDWFPPGHLLVEYAGKAKTVQLADVSYEFSNALCALADEYRDEGMCRVYLGLQPTVMLFRAEFAEKILSDPHNIDKHCNYRFLHPWLGFSLLTSSGNGWRQRRKLLTPAFHFKTLDNYVPIINERCADFIEYLKDLPQKDDIRLFNEMSKLTLDCVGETTMGFKMNSLKAESTYSRALATFQYLVMVRSLRPWVWVDWIYGLLYEGRVARHCVDVLHHWSRTIIHARRNYLARLREATKKDEDELQTPKQAPVADTEATTAHEPTKAEACEMDAAFRKTGTSFLDILLDLHLHSPQLTLEHIREEVDTVLFAGQDTTATTVAFTLYLLGLHKDEEKRALDEVDAVFDNDVDRPVTQDDLRKLKFIEACAKEALRLFPPIPLIGRQLNADLKINNHVIPRGVQLITLVYKLHRDPAHFADPEQFRPDRFLDGRRPDNPFAYVPFSAGPRNCIGQKVALMEVKMILAHFLRHFRVESSWPISKLKICFEVVTRAKGGLRVRLIPRHQN